MKNFFKALGMGCLYVLFVPAIIVILVVGLFYCLGLFIVLSFKAMFAFFGGRSIFKDLEEDVLANKIIEASKTSGLITSPPNEVPQNEPNPSEKDEEDASNE